MSEDWVCPLPWQYPRCATQGETAQQQESSFSKMKDGQSALKQQQEKTKTLVISGFYPLQSFMATQQYQTVLPS